MLEDAQKQLRYPVCDADAAPLRSLRAEGYAVQMKIAKKPDAVAVPDSPDPRQSPQAAEGVASVDLFTSALPPAALPTALRDLRVPGKKRASGRAIMAFSPLLRETRTGRGAELAAAGLFDQRSRAQPLLIVL